MALILARIYFSGIMLVMLNAASTLVFSKTIKKRKFSLMMTAVLLVPLWPLAIFSEEGRKRLLLTASIF